MIERIRSLPASDAETDAMVTRLERRVRRLVTDEGAARSAVEALRAAGAGGADRLEEAAGRLEAEVARILSGLSELYAALLEVEAGAHPAELEILSWLAAEAEIAGAALQAEAERPAAAADRAVREAEAERPPAAGGLAAPEVSRRTR